MQDRSTPLIRLVIGVKDALDNLVKAVSKHQQADGAQTQKDVHAVCEAEVRLPPEVNRYYETENNERKPANRRERIRLCLEIIGVAAAIGLAILTLCTLRTFNGQLEQMRITNQLSKTQWGAQNRPWVGMSNPVQLPRQLTFLMFSGSVPYTGVELNTSLPLKNFGVSPAFKVDSDMALLLTENTLKLPENEMKGACSLADTIPGDNTGPAGSVIFPNTETAQDIGMQSSQPIALERVNRLWVLVCISYVDHTSSLTRHTKVWIVSQMLQDNVKPSFVRQENRGGRMVKFFSLPVRGWLLLKTEAD